MQFGKRIRELRKAKCLTLRDLSQRVGVGFTYLSKIENEKLEEGHQASEQLIHKLAVELDGDEDELLLLAEKVPEPIRRRVMERPDVFHAIAKLDDKRLDRIMQDLAPKRRAKSS
ncbi:Helix-turn-helix domain protein [Rubripirellula obstinata]|uniref:Helix-turn-helix domain protein n=1 Tax=Rubripirellula obstinata TaxID=406547 RepID=A0A5B1CDS2_9BACT|nr:helix-turn-helix transcriptional regulator [Rubripirellula obstinata]KAA1258015.1 Helix-turn-helix domain protein [Rubripirellula obstinata]